MSKFSVSDTFKNMINKDGRAPLLEHHRQGPDPRPGRDAGGHRPEPRRLQPGEEPREGHRAPQPGVETDGLLRGGGHHQGGGGYRHAGGFRHLQSADHPERLYRLPVPDPLRLRGAHPDLRADALAGVNR